MKTSCNVIQDLLPLYHDGVCSEESKELVQEHIAACAQCKDFLHNLKEEAAPDKVDAAGALSAIGSAWRKSTKTALVKGLLIAFLICGIIFGALVAAMEVDFIEISTHAMKVSEIYQLQDGRILFKLDVPNGVHCRNFRFIYAENGCKYQIPVRPLISTTELQGFGSYLDSYMMIDPAENNAWAKSQGMEPITAWYLGSPDSSIPLLIYEEGMIPEPAPAELEAIYGKG